MACMTQGQIGMGDTIQMTGKPSSVTKQPLMSSKRRKVLLVPSKAAGTKPAKNLNVLDHNKHGKSAHGFSLAPSPDKQAPENIDSSKPSPSVMASTAWHPQAAVDPCQPDCLTNHQSSQQLRSIAEGEQQGSPQQPATVMEVCQGPIAGQPGQRRQNKHGISSVRSSKLDGGKMAEPMQPLAITTPDKGESPRLAMSGSTAGTDIEIIKLLVFAL